MCSFLNAGLVAHKLSSFEILRRFIVTHAETLELSDLSSMVGTDSLNMTDSIKFHICFYPKKNVRSISDEYILCLIYNINLSAERLQNLRSLEMT